MGARPAATGHGKPASQPWPATPAELAALATKAARYPAFGAPSLKDWAYTNVLQTHFPGLPNQTIQMWQQIGSDHAAQMVAGRPRTNIISAGSGAQLGGWPGNDATLYSYLAGCPPARPRCGR